MKFIFLICFITVAFTQSQLNTYVAESIGHFSISQTQVDNWQQGGESSVTGQVNIKTNVVNNHGFWSESNC